MLFSPKLFSMLQKSYNQSLEGNENQLQIQSVGINTKILEGGEEQLENGAWHRFPERGNPEIGGNFILSGHSFVWAYTPWQVSEKSYFYNLKDVKVGDEVTVRWNSKDYNYKVDSVFSIDPSQTNIEDKSDTPIMTIYTCTEGGSADGRVVVVAKPVTQQ
jgi:sortase A